MISCEHVSQPGLLMTNAFMAIAQNIFVSPRVCVVSQSLLLGRLQRRTFPSHALTDHTAPVKNVSCPKSWRTTHSSLPPYLRQQAPLYQQSQSLHHGSGLGSGAQHMVAQKGFDPLATLKSMPSLASSTVNQPYQSMDLSRSPPSRYGDQGTIRRDLLWLPKVWRHTSQPFRSPPSEPSSQWTPH